MKTQDKKKLVKLLTYYTTDPYHYDRYYDTIFWFSQPRSPLECLGHLHKAMGSKGNRKNTSAAILKAYHNYRDTVIHHLGQTAQVYKALSIAREAQEAISAELDKNGGVEVWYREQCEAEHQERKDRTEAESKAGQLINNITMIEPGKDV